MGRKVRWLSQRLEYFVLSIAVAIFAALVAWWFIFARRLIGHEQALAEDLLAFTTPDAVLRQQGVAALESRADRLLLMIAGESGLFVLALILCMVVLFVVARRRQDARVRMERMLQFTSHELKTPIAGVRALLQSLELGSVPPTQHAPLLKSGIAECDRLEHLAETILAYQRAVSTPEGGPVQAHDTEALISQVLAHRAHGFGAEAISVAPALGARVFANADAFRVILENLLDNARKYGGGKVELVSSTEGSRWSLSVRDSGQGFDPQLSERLFDPFARADTGAVSHGSGLGLSLSRQLARQMGGELSASSEGAGKGSCFTLQLPLAPRAAALASQPVAHG
jgi:two-component system sensor histidine kinase SenX3